MMAVKTSLITINLRSFKLVHDYSNPFNLSGVGKFSLKSLGIRDYIWRHINGRKICRCSLTSSQNPKLSNFRSTLCSVSKEMYQKVWCMCRVTASLKNVLIFNILVTINVGLHKLPTEKPWYMLPPHLHITKHMLSELLKKENWFKCRDISWIIVIISHILITFTFVWVVILPGEIRFWSLLGSKELL